MLFVTTIASQSVDIKRNVTIRCQIAIRGFNCDEVKGLTMCDNNDLIVTDPSTYVEGVSYRNGSELSYFDVISIEALRIMNTNVNFIPKNITDFLPYLRGLQLSDTNLIFLEKESLEQFGERLQCLSISRNKLISLGNDVFEFNHNLLEISFHTNPLKFIARDIFSELYYLRQVHFTSCRDSSIYGQYRNMTIFDCIHGCDDMAAPERIRRTVAQKYQSMKSLKSNPQLTTRMKSSSENEVSTDECLSYILQIQKQEELIDNLKRQLEKALQKHLICDLVGKISIKCDIFIDYDQANIGSIKIVSGEIPDLAEIKILIVNNSSMMFLPTNVNEKFGKLEKLNATSSKLMKIERKTLNMKNLKSLDLTDNFLTAIPFDAFLDLPHLEELILTRNKLVSFSFEFVEPLKKLAIFSLQQNSIEKLDRIPASMKNIKRLNLKYNKCVGGDFPTNTLNDLNRTIGSKCLKP